MKRLFYLLSVFFVHQCNAAHCSGNDMDLLFHHIAKKETGKVKECIEANKIRPDYFYEPRKLTAFGYAAQVGSLSVFKCLLREGRKVNAHIKINERLNELGGQELTTLQVAEKFGHQKIVKLIQKETEQT